MRKLNFVICISLVLFNLFSCNSNSAKESSNENSVTTTKNEDSIVKLIENDPIIEKFKEEAQSKIDYLIKFMEEHESDSLYRFAVKTEFIQEDKSEHMWVVTNKYSKGHFIGYLANEPGIISSIKYGDTLSVKKEDVEDWILQDFLTNTQVGGFSKKYIDQKK